MELNLKRKLTGFAAASALALAMAPAAAMGVGASVLDTTATDADPAGPGYELTLSGLEQGDKAEYYQIIMQDLDDPSAQPPHVGTQQWKLTQAVDADDDGIVDGTESTSFGHKDANGNAVDGLWVDEMVISSYDVDDEDNPTKVTSDTRQLTPDMVNAISTAVAINKAKGNTTATSAGTADTSGTITLADAAPGMYMFVATPAAGDTDYLYKPIFLSADYYNSISLPEDNTHQIEIVEGETDYTNASGTTGNAGVFKRSPLSIDKQSGGLDANGDVEEDAEGNYDTKQDVAVGDVIEFSIKVPVPTFTENYLAPQFYVTDVLTSGLKLDTSSIQVKVMNGESVITTAVDKDYYIFYKGSPAKEGVEYKDFKGMSSEPEQGFVVQFLADDPTADGTHDGFLYHVTGAPMAIITYTATVTTEEGAKFAQQVNQMDNTAKLEFSHDPTFVPDGYFDEDGNPDDSFNPNEPNDEEPTGELQDKTRHYTFDIDADVLGRDQSGDVGPGGPGDESDHNKTSEIRKIWVDANGEIIQTKTTSDVVKGGDEENGKAGEYGWLEGAEFTLTKIEDHVTMGAGTQKFIDCEDQEMKFDATTHVLDPNGTNPTSDAKGYIAMKGLDAGKYILKEIKAPLGYAFNPNIQYQITITPTYVMEPATPTAGNTPEDGKGGADDLILESYQIEIVAQKLDSQMNIIEPQEEVTTISTYNIKQTDGVPDSMLNEDGTQNENVTIDTTVTSFGNNETAMIMNKKLGLLPATGGSGILFYVFIGAAIMALAVFLARRNRKESAGTAAA